MKIITKREVIRTVLQRINQQYPPHSQYRQFPSKYPELSGMFERVERLNLESCSEADVIKAMGNRSWTELRCNECQDDVDWLLHLGEEPDYESNTFFLCRKCIKVAIALAIPIE